MNQSNYEFYRKSSPANYPESNGELSTEASSNPFAAIFPYPPRATNSACQITKTSRAQVPRA